MLAGVVIAASPALAADLPHRKPGLWDFRITRESVIGFTFQQCIDAETDQVMMLSAGPLPQEVCPRLDVQRSGDTIRIDSICTLKDKTATSHAVITGSMDSAYTMTVIVESEAILGGMNLMTEGQWIGSCTPDQKPGDMVMGKGLTFTATAVLSGVMPMLTDDLPTRKAGLWEVRQVTEEPGQAPPAAELCIDAASDRLVRSITDPDPWVRLVCPHRDVQKVGDTITTDATCKVMPFLPGEGLGSMPSVNVHSVVSGSFDSGYTMTVTRKNDSVPNDTNTTTIAARWLGPCPAR
jgi:hypothetical protein